MQYDMNSQNTKSFDTSHPSYASDHENNKSSLHTSSSASLEICEELDFISTFHHLLEKFHFI